MENNQYVYIVTPKYRGNEWNVRAFAKLEKAEKYLHRLRTEPDGRYQSDATYRTETLVCEID